MLNLDLTPEELDDLKAGREEPYNKIVKFAFPYFCGYVRRLSNGNVYAKDIAQEAFINFYLCNKKTGFESVPKIMSWLHRACINAYINQVRHNEYERRYLEHLINAAESADGAYIETAMAAKVAAEMKQVLESEIENLPDKCKDIFKLVYYEELPTSEIAARLNISAANVSTQKENAIQKLKKKLSNKTFLLMVLLITISGEKYFFKKFLIFDISCVHHYITGPVNHTIKL